MNMCVMSHPCTYLWSFVKSQVHIVKVALQSDGKEGKCDDNKNRTKCGR